MKKMQATEKLSYQMLRAYIMDKSNKKEEGRNEAKMVLEEIKKGGYKDVGLIEQVELVTREMNLQ